MSIQNVASSSMPSGNAVDGGPRVTGSASNASSTSVAVQAQTASANPSPANLQTAVENINVSLKQSGISAQFSIDPNTKQNVMQILDSSTGDLISQYPTKTAIAISEAIDREMQRGVLLNRKA